MADCSTYTQPIGVDRAILYFNNNVRFRRPDISKENEVDIINYGGGSILIENSDDPVWTRVRSTGANYKEMFLDSLQFNLYGLTEENEAIMKELRENIYGFIMELQLNSGKNIVFQSPVFLRNEVSFDFNNGGHIVTVSYAIPTFKNYLTKLNDLVFVYSFIFTGPDSVLAYDNNNPVIINY